MTRLIAIFIVLVPIMARAELIELKCVGDEYNYNSDMSHTVNKEAHHIIVLNTKTRKMDIIRGVKSKTVRYTEDRNFVRAKFDPHEFILDDKILYEFISINRYTGEIFSKYQIGNKDSLYNSFVGICGPTKRKF